MRLIAENHIIEAKEDGVYYTDSRTKNLYVAYDEIESPEIATFQGVYIISFTYLAESSPYFAFTFGDMTDQSKALLFALKDFTDAMIKRAERKIQTNDQIQEMIKTLSMAQEAFNQGLIDIATFDGIKAKLNTMSINLDPPSKADNNINKDDFYIYNGEGTWNFIDRYRNKDHAWFELSINDTEYRISRGLAIYSTKRDIVNSFNVTPEIDNNYDYTNDDLYMWSHLENKYRETLNLPLCDSIIRYHLNWYESYDYTITFYFMQERLVMVGYTKKRTKTVS